MGSRLGRWLVAAAAAIVILGGSIAPFLAPPVVRFEQDRAGAPTLTRYQTRAALDAVTTSLLGDLVLWRGDFAYDLPGDRFVGPELSDAERAHMIDVRRVFTGLWVLVLAGIVTLVLAFGRAKDREARAAAWRAVGYGARALAAVVATLGAVALVAFDAAFEIFHRLFFSAGSYTFDPTTSKLVQLFPDQFWFEITIAVGIVSVVVSSIVAWAATRRASRPAPDTAASTLTATRAGT